MSFRQFFSLLRYAWHRWLRSDTGRLAASVAFNAVLSLAPLLLLTAAGAILGKSAARARILDLAERMVGAPGRLDAEKNFEAVAHAKGKAVAGAVGAILEHKPVAIDLLELT